MKRILHIWVLVLLAAAVWPLSGDATDNCGNLPSPTVLAWNGLLPTPRMGVSTWYAQGSAPTEAYVKTQADGLVSTGLLAAGYNFVVVDDGWPAASRDGGGNLVANATRFPDGMAATVTYVHADGEKFGIYSSPYSTTCAGYLGSYQHESADATQFATWGADFLNYDGCNVDAGYSSCYSTAGPQIWQLMAQDIRAGSRPMIIQVGTTPSPWANLWLWAKPVGQNEYRFDQQDINGLWANFDGAIDIAAGLSGYSAVGYWANADMLMNGTGSGPLTGTFTATQQQTQFGMDSLWSSPLIFGTDVTAMSSGLLAMYKNPEVIAVDQDALGLIAKRTSQTSCGSATCEVWTKMLWDGNYALGLLNRASTTQTVTANLSAYSNPDVRDLFARSDLGHMTSYSVSLPAYGMALVLVTPNGGTAMQNVVMQNMGIR
jgi:alpha-galactosidase